MSFNDEERAELIAALSHTTEMVGLLLDALDFRLLLRLSEDHRSFASSVATTTNIVHIGRCV